MPELKELYAESMLGVMRGYLVMLNKDLGHARSNRNAVLIAELNEVIARVEHEIANPEEIILGIEFRLNRGEEELLAREIRIMGQEFGEVSGDYIANEVGIVCALDELFNALDYGEDIFIDPEAGLVISSAGIVDLSTGDMNLFF